MADIKAGNIMFGVDDATLFEKFEQAEIDHPAPRKEVDRRIIYLSRGLGRPAVTSLGLPVLCDFGSAAWGEETNEEDVQPDIYRSPEVMLNIPWSYEIDIWNVGCMVSDFEHYSRLH
jgi:serine/threonine protein kinase